MEVGPIPGRHGLSRLSGRWKSGGCRSSLGNWNALSKTDSLYAAANEPCVAERGIGMKMRGPSCSCLQWMPSRYRPAAFTGHPLVQHPPSPL